VYVRSWNACSGTRIFGQHCGTYTMERIQWNASSGTHAFEHVYWNAHTRTHVAEGTGGHVVERM
jgi:hypothetical protein